MAKLKRHYGRVMADDFGPALLRELRQRYLDHKVRVTGKKLTRTTINRYVCYIVRAFRWASADELISPSTYYGLLSVEKIKMGRTTAPEQKRRLPVEWSRVEATFEYLKEPAPAIIKIMYLADMRPEEACSMRMQDVDMKPDANGCWTYTPQTHKSAHLGKSKKIKLGRKAQEIVKEYATLKENDYLFRPINPAATTPYLNPTALGDRIRNACLKGNIEPWCIYMVRHTRNTELDAQFGRGGAKACAGHAKEETTEGYIDRDDLALASQIMSQIG